MSQIAARPTGQAVPLKLQSNFTRISFDPRKVFKYSLTITLGDDGEIPDGMNWISR
jgi:hypothetical protein